MQRSEKSQALDDRTGPALSVSRSGMFLTHVVQLVSGTTISQVLAILVSPILSRLFQPEVFGSASVFSALTFFLGICSCLRFELSISLPEKDEDAANLLCLSILNSLGTSSLIFLLLSMWGDDLLVLLKAQPLKHYLWLIPIQVFLIGSSLAFSYWHIRCRRFSRLAWAMIIQTATSNGLQLGIGFAGWPTVGTRIGSNVSGSAASLVVFAHSTWKNDRHRFFQAVGWRPMIRGLFRYRKFLYISTWAAVLSGFSLQLPVFFLSMFFTSRIVGFFALANRLLLMPVSVIGDAVAQVFYQQAVQYNREGKVADLIAKVFHGLIQISFLPFFLLSVMGRELFVFVFDKQWAEAGIFAQLLAASAFVMFISVPISTLFTILEKQEVGLKMQILIFVSRFSSLLIGGKLGSPRLAVALYSLFGALVFIYLSRQIYKYAGMKMGKVFSVFWNVMKPALPYMAVIVTVKLLVLRPWLVTVISLLLLLVYFFSLSRRESEMFSLLLKNIRRRNESYRGIDGIAE